MWAALLVIVFGVMFFGLTSLVLAWFQPLEGVAGPVTELGYGSLVGIILTVGIASQVINPERWTAGIQQAALVVPALLAGSALARDAQNVEAAGITFVGLALLVVLHPSSRTLLALGVVSRPMLLLAIAGAVPWVGYAVEMGNQAQRLLGPPHHVQRLSTMAALAIAIILVALLASLRTRGWRLPAWCAGLAAITYGLASVLYPDHPSATGLLWGGAAVVGGCLFIGVAEWEARRPAA